jgi:hypothetical protein
MNISIPRKELHRKVYLYGLAMLVCCLPLSKYVLSISQFLLLLNWLAEGRFNEKAGLLRRHPLILLFASGFLIYGLGMLCTDNVAIGLVKVKNALPLLMLPIVMGTSPPLTKATIKWLMLLFAIAVFAAAMICLINFLFNITTSINDFREISIFMLHIRFSLLIVMAVLILFYLASHSNFPVNKPEIVAYYISGFLLICFLIFLRSFTGIILFVVTFTVFIVNTALKSNRIFIRYFSLSLVLLSYIVFITLIVLFGIKNFYARPVNIANLDLKTVNGNLYNHDPVTGVLENGNYVDLYVCETELKKEWNNISTIPYDSFDNKGQYISYTLRRYLTSKNLRKDSTGIHQLDKADIQAIENGLANFRFDEKPGLSQRLYETLWEIHMFNKTGYVESHSFGQRIIFLKIARNVIRKHFWCGVGTGDVLDAMLKQARDDLATLEYSWEGKPHNQYAFFIIAFGIFGFLWIILSWIYPVFVNRSYNILLFNLFATIILISMLAIDTLESYDSIVFFTFFYCLFIFCYKTTQTAKDGNNLYQRND